MNNLFFFREEYDVEEKLDRIPANAFTTSSDVVQNFVSNEIPGEFDINETNKEDTIARLRTEIDAKTFETFVNNLFEEEGKRGDKFNIRLFDVPNNINGSILKKNLEEAEGDEFTQDIDGTLTILNLEDFDTNLESDLPYIDLKFKTPIKENEYKPSEEKPVKITDESGGIVAYSDNPNHTVNILSNQMIEARVYLALNSIAISNSSIDKKYQKAITLLIDKIGQESNQGGSDEGGDDNES